jgi:hypothetical protein
MAQNEPKTQKYRLVSGKHRYRDPKTGVSRTLQPGEEIELTDAQYASFSDRFSPSKKGADSVPGGVDETSVSASLLPNNDPALSTETGTEGDNEPVNANTNLTPSATGTQGASPANELPKSPSQPRPSPEAPNAPNPTTTATKDGIQKSAEAKPAGK